MSWIEEYYDDGDFFDGEPLGLSDVEADSMTLASAGYGTDEDYGCFSDDNWACGTLDPMT